MPDIMMMLYGFHSMLVNLTDKPFDKPHTLPCNLHHYITLVKKSKPRAYRQAGYNMTLMKNSHYTTLICFVKAFIKLLHDHLIHCMYRVNHGLLSHLNQSSFITLVPFVFVFPFFTILIINLSNDNNLLHLKFCLLKPILHLLLGILQQH